MVKLGICAGADKAKCAQGLGYDYIELNLTNLSEMTDEQFGETKRLIDESRITAEAFNVMIPGKYRLTGEGVDLAAVREYLERVIPRAAALGCKVIVFGSGAARRVPEGFSHEKAMGQLAEYLRLVREVIAPFGIRIAVEPLNKGETNIIHTVDDGVSLALLSRADLAADSALLPLIGGLGDTFHMYQEEEGFAGLARAGANLYHVHTATNVSRFYPKDGDGTDYVGMFRALNEAGYDARVSVEGNTTDFEADAAAALETLKKARQTALINE